MLLDALLKQTGVPVELITVEGAGHGLRNGAPEDVRAALQRENDFLAEHLGVTAPKPQQRPEAAPRDRSNSAVVRQ